MVSKAAVDGPQSVTPANVSELEPHSEARWHNNLSSVLENALETELR